MTSSQVTECRRRDCDGTIEDGFCDACGMAPALPSASAGQARADSAGSGPSISGGPPSGSSTPSGGRAGFFEESLGAGMVDLPAVPERDPLELVMAKPEVPEDRRFCHACDKPVGRSRNGRPGRPEGYCASCGQPYSFVAKLTGGEMVAGQYVVVGCLAHGGLGWVYLAYDRRVNDKRVVLKGLRGGADPDTMINERRFLAEVDHSSIVRIVNFVTHDGDGYIVMDYVGDVTLKALRQDHHAAHGAPLPPADAIRYVLAILPALGYLHDRGLLYCDFKPDNVMVSGRRVRLIDMGGVRRADDDLSDVYGTVGYQAPEVPVAGPSISSDLYTVGRSLALLTMDIAGFTDPDRYATDLPAASHFEILARHRGLDRFLRKATHADPGMRFDSAAEMADQLRGVLCQVEARDGGRRVAPRNYHFNADPVAEPAASIWRDLPSPVVDPDDAAFHILGGLGAASADQRHAALVAAAPTIEIRLQIARVRLELGDISGAEAIVDSLLTDNPLDWRPCWWKGVLSLANGRSNEAAVMFETVASRLPGELAPVVALALANEMTQPTSHEAEADYAMVAAADGGCSAAVFGRARVQSALGDRDGAADTLGNVASTLIFSSAARVEQAKLLLADSACGPPQPAHLHRAAAAIEAVAASDGARLTLEYALYRCALSLLSQAAVATDPSVRVAGVPLVEPALRTALSKNCMARARAATSATEQFTLVDEANTWRCVSWF